MQELITANPSLSDPDLDFDEYGELAQEIAALDKNRVAKILNLLTRLGFPTHFHGYWYLLRIIDQVTVGNMRLGFATKLLYPDTAKQFGTTAYAVERDIRYLIAWTWEHGDTSTWDTLLGRHATNPPSNIAFMRICVNQLKCEILGFIPLDLVA